MQKFLPFLFVVFIIFLGGIGFVDAVSLSPASGTLAANSTQNINIVASPPANAEAVQIRLTLTGDATITGYTGPTDSAWNPGAIGVCAGNTTYTTTQVCVDLANSGTIETGESLGTISVTTGASGSFTISRADGNGYLVNDVIQEQTGMVGTYTIGSVTQLPDTSIVDEPKYVIVLGALSIILTGVVVFRVYPYLRENHNAK